MKSLENIKIERKERPNFLYHSSHNDDIEEFSPRNESVRDPKEGPVVFATPDLALASMFLVEGCEDSWTKIGYYEDVPVMIICSDRDKFIEKDNGGIIYELPGDSFDFDIHKGMKEKEWTSRIPVKPIGKKKHNSSLSTMIENGVQVYFVNKEKFREINEAEDHGLKILAKLKSENELLGKNVRLLRK